MKKCLAALLAVVMILNLSITALALTLTPTADKTTVSAGESVIVSVKADESIEEVSAAELRLYFDDAKFDWDQESSVPSAENISIYAKVCDDAGRKYVRILFIAEGAGKATLGTDTLAQVAFKAKDDISEDASASFSSCIAKVQQNNDLRSDVTAEVPVSVTVTPAAPAVEGYAVAASAVNPAINVGEDAQVALRITNSGAETYNAYYMEISYDSAKLTYKGINTDASVTDNGNALKIADYGKDKTCGTDDILLTFTARSAGEAKVAVASAKVDAKANAVAKDAPAAAVTAAEAAITVGGYQVTLPDGFTGAAAAKPGESYTFTAKDPSKKYDFSGSTMNGEPVTVKDNGDGTYTIENVTGALLIKAVEKAAKVTVRLINNTAATIYQLTDGQEVEPNQSFTFIVMGNADSGGEFVVTANGTTLTGILQAGRFLYTVPADLVTGSELQIVINYKAEDKATIIEDGDWTDVVYRTGWEKSGDQVAAGTNLNFTMNQQDGYTYTVTVNGTTLTGVARPGSSTYTYIIDGATYVLAGKTTTISITKTAVQPAYTVAVNEYLHLDGRSLFLITAAGDVAEGKLLAYDGSTMYWSEKYNEGKGAYVWLISSDKSLEEVKAEATAAKLTVIDATAANKVSVNYNGDVNLTGTTDINDAQLVWNMYNAEYKADTDFQTVNRLKYLSADMNADGTLDTKDAAAIVAALTK